MLPAFPRAVQAASNNWGEEHAQTSNHQIKSQLWKLRVCAAHAAQTPTAPSVEFRICWTPDAASCRNAQSQCSSAATNPNPQRAAHQGGRIAGGRLHVRVLEVAATKLSHRHGFLPGRQRRFHTGAHRLHAAGVPRRPEVAVHSKVTHLKTVMRLGDFMCLSRAAFERLILDAGT